MAGKQSSNISSAGQNKAEYQKVFYYVPNLIGYTHVADGYYARKFNQCSKFGEVLDMVTDRCTTTCLLTYLAELYPKGAMIFCFLISLDISSHYMQMYGSLITGHTNHKIMDESANFIMRAYYTNRLVLFLFCLGNEAFFILLYLVHYLDGFLYYFFGAIMLVAFPISVAKNAINLVQLWEASKQLAEFDVKETAATTKSISPSSSATKASKD
ncbi:phosphatidylinositol synthase 1 (CDP-alcohol phosphatidyltransferase1) [Mycoemilia scoparia]|uniref:CDP-diacylglycerol--inositol 3-phosphatidyltransferase n=1 Tax=Mycoemilia scoparia TaxID=417184 RepID=A0A9W7ZTP0_9FUNG|nr:phosphatidylinositol synthase 1 (CDP-alcohol phosphatidyltransferase1) [Mycoemilia scoparia]